MRCIGIIVGSLLLGHAYAMDLIQTYQQALINDPGYLSARYALSAGKEAQAQGRSALLPAVDLGGNYNRSGESWKTLTNNYSLQLTQPLFRPVYWQQYQQGKLSVASSEIQFAQAQQDLMLRVAQAYFDVLTAQDVLTFLQSQKAAITQQLASAKRNFDIGTATITDSNEAQARYDLAVAQEIGANNNLALARDELQQIIGQTPPVLANLRTGIKLSAPQPAVLETWMDRAGQENMSVLAQEIALENAKHEITKRRAGHLPSIDLVASRAHSSVKGSDIPFYNVSQMLNSIGVQWNIPLSSGGEVNSAVRQAVALEQKAQADLEKARRIATSSARQAYLGVSSGLAQVQAYEAAEISSRSSLESNQLGYEVGVRINIDVLNAQQQLFSTRRDLAKARYDTLMSGLKLKAAVGVLQEEDLLKINGLLAPVSY